MRKYAILLVTYTGSVTPLEYDTESGRDKILNKWQNGGYVRGQTITEIWDSAHYGNVNYGNGKGWIKEELLMEFDPDSGNRIGKRRKAQMNGIIGATLPSAHLMTNVLNPGVNPSGAMPPLNLGPLSTSNLQQQIPSVQQSITPAPTDATSWWQQQSFVPGLNNTEAVIAGSALAILFGVILISVANG